MPTQSLDFSFLSESLVLNRASTPGEFDPAAMHQLAPLGEHRGMMPSTTGGAPTPIIQVIDQEAVDEMVKNFAPSSELLVDYEHNSHDADKDTTAAAWINQLKADPKHGLLFGSRWSEKGLSDVKGLNYRFISPEFPVSGLVPLGGNRFRPTRVSGAGLTNRPQLKTLQPLSNRDASAAASESPTRNPENTMDHKLTLLAVLGLASSVTDAEIQAAAASHQNSVATINNRVASLETEITGLKSDKTKLLEAVVEADLITHAAVIENRDAVKAQLIANRDGTLAILGALKKTAPAAIVSGAGTAPAVHNREAAAGAGAVVAAGGKSAAAAEPVLTGRARTEAALKKAREAQAAKA